MKKGERALFTIKADHAYGTSGSPPKIPPNADLQFDVELISWLSEEDVTKKKDRGVLKTINVEGTGWDKPKDDSKVTVKYTIWESPVPHGSDITLPVDNSKFIESTEKNNASFTIGAEEVPLGIDRAVQSMKKGEKATLSIRGRDYGYTSDLIKAKNLPIKLGIDLMAEIELVDFTTEKPHWELKGTELLEVATRKKEEGNTLFREGKIKRAKKKYKSAISVLNYDPVETGYDDMDFEEDTEDEEKEKKKEKENKQNKKAELKEQLKQPKVACYLNVSACYAKERKWKKVLENANKALEVEPQNAKARYRRGQANLETSEWDLAKKDFEKILEIDPKNNEAKKELYRTKQLMEEHYKKEKQLFSNMFQFRAH